MIRLSIILLISMFLIAGCARVNEPTYEGALFCDVEEKRWFTREEIEVRSARWPENLAKDYRTNLAWDREECEKHLDAPPPY